MKSGFTILHIKNGAIENKAAARKLFGGLSDGKYICEINRWNQRSDPQNRYLHGVLIPQFRMALNQVGYDEVKTDEQAKLIMKSMFLKRQIVNKITGEVTEYIEDTHNLTKDLCNNLIEEVIKFAAENMNYRIPYPNEQTIMDF